MSDLTFKIYDDTTDNGRPIKTGTFSRNWDEEKEMDEIQDLIEAGQLPLEEAIVQAEALLEKYPRNLEIHSFLGNQYWDAELKDEAGEIYAAAYDMAVKLIPKTFKGHIPWHAIDNRSFLRVAHGNLLSLMYQRNGRKAHALANKLLMWCPDDNLGVRYLIGDIKMISGDLQAALKTFVKEADDSPVNWYPAALITFRLGDYVRACTYLRKGIAGNPYVAEALTGRTLLANHLYWHSSNLHDCDFAIDYLESAGNDWTPNECDFIDWVFNSAEVLRERAALMEVHEALTSEHDFAGRHPWVERSMGYSKTIDDRLSEAMIRKIPNRWGDQIWPWDREGHQHPAAFLQARHEGRCSQ